VREQKTASAMGERQIFPRQTKRTDIEGVAVISFGISLTAIEAAERKRLCPVPPRETEMRVKNLVMSTWWKRAPGWDEVRVVVIGVSCG